MAQVEPRNSPINIRARRAQRDLIDKAAATVSKNRSDFMLEAACREAENVLLDKRLFLLDNNKFEEFETALQKPISDNPAIQKLFSHKSSWEK